jgi:hypothetical protein
MQIFVSTADGDPGGTVSICRSIVLVIRGDTSYAYFGSPVILNVKQNPFPVSCFTSASVSSKGIGTHLCASVVQATAFSSLLHSSRPNPAPRIRFRVKNFDSSIKKKGSHGWTST